MIEDDKLLHWLRYSTYMRAAALAGMVAAAVVVVTR